VTAAGKFFKDITFLLFIPKANEYSWRVEILAVQKALPDPLTAMSAFSY
jgi:hypothetical protein